MKVVIGKTIYGGTFIDKYILVVEDTEKNSTEHIQVDPREWERAQIYEIYGKKE
jgi:hypothetical protein